MTGSDTRVVAWKTWPEYSRYEASDRGQIRNRAGHLMSIYPDPDGYLRLTLTRDDGVKRSVHVHRAVLLAHAGEPAAGEEACHGPGGQQDNRWPENLRWGTKPSNERDKIAAGRKQDAPRPFECLNFARCGNMVAHEGRRCLGCVTEVGREAAVMLGRGVNLMDVAQRFGYTGPDWVFQLACKHGGWVGTKRDALAQHPSRAQRVTGKVVTLRDRWRGRLTG